MELKRCYTGIASSIEAVRLILAQNYPNYVVIAGPRFQLWTYILWGGVNENEVKCVLSLSILMRAVQHLAYTMHGRVFLCFLLFETRTLVEQFVGSGVRLSIASASIVK